jgi:M6 family metalloprotease-like protein
MVLGFAAILASAALASPGVAVAATEPPPALAPLDDCRPPSPFPVPYEGFPIEESALPSVGTAHITTIYADFTDVPGDPGAIGGVEEILDAGIEVLETQSGERLAMELETVAQWARMPLPSSEYAGIPMLLMTDAVAAVDGLVDFSETDVLWLVIPPGNLWDRSNEFHPVIVPTMDGTITRGVIFNQGNFEAPREWLVVHESGHTLGLPDLYDTRAIGDWIFPFTGTWDPMGDSLGRGREFFGWHLWRLGWIDDGAVSCVATGTMGVVTLDSLGLRGGSTIAVVRLSESEVLVVESRQPDGYDENVDSKPGALVYRVRTDVPSGNGPIQVMMPDGAPPFESLGESVLAPLAPGERYTDPSGVIVEAIPRSDPGAHEDVVRIDTQALAPAPGPDPVMPPAVVDPAAQPAATTTRLPDMGPNDPAVGGLAAGLLAGVGVILVWLGRTARTRRDRSAEH